MSNDAMRAYDDWYPNDILRNDRPSFSEWESAWARKETPPQRMHLYLSLGHGYVYQQAKVMRCGGPGICVHCHEEHLLVKHAMKVGYFLGGKALTQGYSLGPAKYPPLLGDFNPVIHFKAFSADILKKKSTIGTESNAVQPDPSLEKLVKNLALMTVPPCSESEFDAWVADQAAIIRRLVISEMRPPQGVHLQLTANPVDMSNAFRDAGLQMKKAVDAFVKSMSEVKFPIDLQPTERKDHD